MELGSEELLRAGEPRNTITDGGLVEGGGPMEREEVLHDDCLLQPNATCEVYVQNVLVTNHN